MFTPKRFALLALLGLPLATLQALSHRSAVPR
ncbi:hypothetical protein J2X10_002129 [Pseudomonas peli]|nr:hypothetical protein [Pseudomonas peli]